MCIRDRDNGKGENGQGHIISAAARRLLEVNGGDDGQACLAPPDLWNRRQDTDVYKRQAKARRGIMEETHRRN